MFLPLFVFRLVCLSTGLLKIYQVFVRNNRGILVVDQDQAVLFILFNIVMYGNLSVHAIIFICNYERYCLPRLSSQGGHHLENLKKSGNLTSVGEVGEIRKKQGKIRKIVVCL